jgi:hypothetical protein
MTDDDTTQTPKINKMKKRLPKSKRTHIRRLKQAARKSAAPAEK